MRFHILGLGPIGSLLSLHLRRIIPESHPITLIHKSQSQARKALQRGGSIHVETNGQVTTANGFKSQVFEDIPEKSTSTPSGPDTAIESLFVTTKAHQTLPAVRRLLPRLSQHSTIVLLQNGMGVYEELVQQIFKNPAKRPHFILASNTHGAFLKTYHHVVHSGIGSIEFAILPDPTGRDFELSNAPNAHERRLRIADITTSDDTQFHHYQSLRNTVAALTLLRPLNISWKPISEVGLAIQRKLVVNAVINPLTALMGCRNGDIFTSPAAQHLCRKVCREAADAYAAQIMSRIRTSGITTKTEHDHVPSEFLCESLQTEVLRVAEITKDNVSSMLADIRKGRGTEIDYINGYLLKLGATYHVNMPVNATLVNLVQMRSAIPLDQML
ncbi:ketopantoate reductase PanE/ApbA C terminal-domain-containing protein [Cyathus striatus]|nr:ketopantoate reductase PanE/ApbA C terminal-domain-containing protein [Cyathus striatus]